MTQFIHKLQAKKCYFAHITCSNLRVTKQQSGCEFGLPCFSVIRETCLRLAEKGGYKV